QVVIAQAIRRSVAALDRAAFIKSDQSAGGRQVTRTGKHRGRPRVGGVDVDRDAVGRRRAQSRLFDFDAGGGGLRLLFGADATVELDDDENYRRKQKRQPDAESRERAAVVKSFD